MGPDQANRFAPQSKQTAYEGGVRTPIMIRWPGRVTPPTDREHLARTVDLWPTLAALLNTDIPPGLPGINLTDTEAVAGRHMIFGEQYAHNIADVDAPTRSLQHRWMIDGWTKLILPIPENRPRARPELYDLRVDHWEKDDLGDGQVGRVNDLVRILDHWWSP